MQRHELGLGLLENPAAGSAHPEPDFSLLDPDAAVPEARPEDLTPEFVRAAILGKGALIVRGLVDRDTAVHFESEIEKAFAARDAMPPADADGYHEFQPENDGYYRPFHPKAGPLPERGFVTDAGGIWAADSPKLTFEVIEMIERAGLQHIIRGYLGEDPAFSLQKCTLRKVAPTAGNGYPGWHQDGRFLGDVRALNVWLTLTHCGDDAPGLYLVPRRVEEIAPTGTEGAVFDWVVSPTVVDEVRGDLEIVKPIFEPGDAMLFDDLFLHSTAADPAMPNHRYAIESWFFGPSGFPDRYVPLGL